MIAALFFVILLFFVSGVSASTYSMLRNGLDAHVANDSSRWLVGTYKGNLKITNAEELSERKFDVEGTFNTETEFGSVLTRHYKARVKIVLGDVVIESCCWETAFGTKWCTKQNNMLINELDTHIENDSSRWLVGTYIGNLKITDIEKLSERKFDVEGTFNTKTEFGAILTRHYKSRLKVVLDEVVIMSCCWETAFGIRWCTK